MRRNCFLDGCRKAIFRKSNPHLPLTLCHKLGVRSWKIDSESKLKYNTDTVCGFTNVYWERESKIYEIHLKIRNVTKNYTRRFFHLQHFVEGGCYGRYSYSDVEGALLSESSTFNLITGEGVGGGGAVLILAGNRLRLGATQFVLLHVLVCKVWAQVRR